MIVNNMIKFKLVILLLLILLSYVECAIVSCHHENVAFDSAGSQLELSCPSGKVPNTADLIYYAYYGDSPLGILLTI